MSSITKTSVNYYGSGLARAGDDSAAGEALKKTTTFKLNAFSDADEFSTRRASELYHKKLTEIYLIIEGEGFMELDGELIPVKPLTAIFIKPGCRHRAVGKMRIVNIPIPAFDPGDEWFD